MKITGVTTALLPGGEFGRATAAASAPTCVVALATDAGLTGTGFCAGDARAAVERVASAVLQGEDPRGVTGLWQRMADCVAGGAGAAALAALDLALWDLKAQQLGEPLWRALGGRRPRIRVHAGACGAEADDAAFDAWYAPARAAGVRGALVPASDSAERDAARLGRLRASFAGGPTEPALMLDFDGRFAPKDAARRVRALERGIDLVFVQDPAGSRDAAGARRVSDAIRAAVCGGGRLASPDEFLTHFQARALDVVMIGAGNGGVTGALQVADTAYGYELPVVLAASPGHLHTHLGAVLPYCMGMEARIPERGGVVATDVRIEDGWAVAGDRPGHGISVDPRVFEAAR